MLKNLTTVLCILGDVSVGAIARCPKTFGLFDGDSDILYIKYILAFDVEMLHKVI